VTGSGKAASITGMAGLGAIVARNVRAERARRGWKQSELGAHLGWAVSTVSAVETGQRRLAVDDLPALCRVFDIPLAKLLDGAATEDLAALNL
jgi:transcriptional regulator with XRE-family HTH domain